jgi:branched-chain amino acid transport system substrate-binding protein
VRRAGLAPLLVLALAASACSGHDDTPAPTTTVPDVTTTMPPRENLDGVLTLGVLLPKTGPAASLGAPMITAVRMAVEEINSSGGVNGHPVRLAEGDEGADATTAAESLNELLNVDQVDAIIGPASSKVALALLDTTVKAKALTCSPTNTAIALTTYPHRGLYFRTMPSDALQGRALGKAIAGTGRRSVSVIYPDDDYGRPFSNALTTELRRQDVEIKAADAYDPSAASFEKVVADALDPEPESVAVIGASDPGGKILAGLRAVDAFPSRLPTFVTDGMRRSDLFEQVVPGQPRSVSGISGTSPAAVPSGAQWFVSNFEQFSGGGTLAYAAYAYDCANLIALSALGVGNDDPLNMATEMVPLSRSGTVCRSFQDCAPLIVEGRGVDLDGASGPIEFTSTGDVSVGTFDQFSFDDTGRDVATRQLVVSMN